LPWGIVGEGSALPRITPNPIVGDCRGWRPRQPAITSKPSDETVVGEGIALPRFAPESSMRRCTIRPLRLFFASLRKSTSPRGGGKRFALPLTFPDIVSLPLPAQLAELWERWMPRRGRRRGPMVCPPLQFLTEGYIANCGQPMTAPTTAHGKASYNLPDPRN